jgi:hypothetical protein
LAKVDFSASPLDFLPTIGIIPRMNEHFDKAMDLANEGFKKADEAFKEAAKGFKKAASEGKATVTESAGKPVTLRINYASKRFKTAWAFIYCACEMLVTGKTYIRINTKLPS